MINQLFSSGSAKVERYRQPVHNRTPEIQGRNRQPQEVFTSSSRSEPLIPNPLKTGQASPTKKFWSGFAVGGMVSAAGCLALGATGPIGAIIVGCTALVSGVHCRDGGISQEKLEQLGDFQRSVFYLP